MSVSTLTGKSGFDDLCYWQYRTQGNDVINQRIIFSSWGQWTHFSFLETLQKVPQFLCSSSYLIIDVFCLFLQWDCRSLIFCPIFYFVVFLLLQLQQCIAVSQKASEKIFQFYRDAVRRRYSKSLWWREAAFFFSSFFFITMHANIDVIKKLAATLSCFCFSSVEVSDRGFTWGHFERRPDWTVVRVHNNKGKD